MKNQHKFLTEKIVTLVSERPGISGDELWDHVSKNYASRGEPHMQYFDDYMRALRSVSCEVSDGCILDVEWKGIERKYYLK